MTDLPKKSRSGPCVYCGDVRRYSVEHVIPRWVRKRVMETGPVQLAARQTGKALRTDETLTLAVTDAVCGQCNGGWMKELGELIMSDAIDAMLGVPVVLTRHRARTLATWAVDRALMFELALREHRKNYLAPKSNLQWLYNHRDGPSPPPGANVYFACLADPEMLPAWSATGRWHPLWNAHKLEDLAPEVRDLEPLGFLSAFSIGHVAFMVFGQDFREPDHLAADGRELARFELPARYGGHVVRVWPDPDELTVWPPRLVLKIADLSNFGDFRDIAVKRRLPKES